MTPFAPLHISPQRPQAQATNRPPGRWRRHGGEPARHGADAVAAGACARPSRRPAAAQLWARPYPRVRQDRFRSSAICYSPGVRRRSLWCCMTARSPNLPDAARCSSVRNAQALPFCACQRSAPKWNKAGATGLSDTLKTATAEPEVGLPLGYFAQVRALARSQAPTQGKSLASLASSGDIRRRCGQASGHLGNVGQTGGEIVSISPNSRLIVVHCRAK